jgi:hypothetical protein
VPEKLNWEKRKNVAWSEKPPPAFTNIRTIYRIQIGLHLYNSELLSEITAAAAIVIMIMMTTM